MQGRPIGRRPLGGLLPPPAVVPRAPHTRYPHIRHATPPILTSRLAGTRHHRVFPDLPRLPNPLATSTTIPNSPNAPSCPASPQPHTPWASP